MIQTQTKSEDDEWIDDTFEMHRSVYDERQTEHRTWRSATHTKAKLERLCEELQKEGVSCRRSSWAGRETCVTNGVKNKRLLSSGQRINTTAFHLSCRFLLTQSCLHSPHPSLITTRQTGSPITTVRLARHEQSILTKQRWRDDRITLYILY